MSDFGKLLMLAKVMGSGGGGGGGGGDGKGSMTDDVVFVDYDGRIVTTYTAQEFLELASMPSLPSAPEGLSQYGWNWELEDAKAQVQDTGGVVIGALYEPASGESVIRTRIRLAEGFQEPHFSFVAAISDADVIVRWGDDSSDTYTVERNEELDASHAYASPGEYVVELEIDKNSTPYAFGYIRGDGDRGSHFCWSGLNGTKNADRAYQASVLEVSLGNQFRIDDYAFYWLVMMQTITVCPSSQWSSFFGSYAFDNCRYLKAVVFGQTYGTGAVEGNSFSSCYSLKALSFSPSSGHISSGAITICGSLERISIPSGYDSYGIGFISNTSSLKRIELSTSATYIGGSVMNSSMLGCVAELRLKNVTNVGYSNVVNVKTLEKLDLGDKLVSIGSGSFCDLPLLKDLTIPASLFEVSGSSFTGLVSLKKLTFLPDTPPLLRSSGSFANLPTDCVIHVPSGTLNAYTTATNYPSPSVYQYVED